MVFGGPDGELGAATRYLSQRYTAPLNEVKGVLTDIGSEAPKMFQNEKSADNPGFAGFLLHTITTVDKVVKYGENNQVKNNEHSMVVQRGEERTINIYVAITDVA